MGLFTSHDDAQPRRALSFHSPRTITAAAAPIVLSDQTEVDRVRRRRQTNQWQNDAWEYYDLIGEMRYAFNVIGAVVSRIRLYAAVTSDADKPPSPASDVLDLEPGVAEAANRVLKKLESARGGIPGLLHDASINLSVAGECYLVQTPAKLGSGTPEMWRIRSIDELVIAPGSSQLSIRASKTAQQNDYEILPNNAVAIRIWRMHPRFSDDADASTRGVLDLCDELLLLSRSARATAKSRLNAGALYVPDGLSVASAPDGELPDTVDAADVMAPYSDGDEDDFIEQLAEAMTTPITDESSASAVVPLLIRGPADLGEKIKAIKFERAFDQALVARGDKVLERILNGIDIPKDVVTGMANVKYSNATLVEASLYKMHVEPLCLLLCDALTVGYLHPMLRAEGYTDEQISRVTIWYDPSAITTKPDKATAANFGFTNHVISDAAWRTANGFSDSDAPPYLELVQRAFIERGIMSEPVTEAVLKTMLPDLMEAARQQALAQSPTGPVPPALENTIEGGPAPAPDASQPPAAPPQGHTAADGSPGEAQGAPPPGLAEPTPT